jgi:glutathione synthase/RimK-type ligase-like ATP-grasp enzyme
VRDFLAGHGRVIYKSISGTRSIVEEVDHDALARLDDVRWCPVQFQAYVEGVDVRVHVVGRRVFSTRVASDAADYRYAAARGGTPARLEATRLSAAVTARCIELTARLGLRFSGIDLRITPDERVVCFEVNPCPAYTYYEGHTGQPIARAVADYLVGVAD